jgi:methyl-accepting chemotaxis protein
MKKKAGIGFRIIAMAIVLSIVAAVIGFIGLYTTLATRSLAEAMYQKDLLRVNYADTMENYVQASLVSLLAANRPGKSKEEVTTYQQTFTEQCEAFETALKKYEGTNIRSDEKKQLLREVQDGANEFITKSPAMFEYTLKGDLDSANKYIDTVIAPIAKNKLNPPVEKLVNIQIADAETAYADSVRISSLAVMFIIVAILVGLALSLTLSIVITRGITKPVSKIVGNLSDSSSQIAISSTQLSGSSQEIANGAQEQAASIEETTSSMEELSSMVKQNLGNTREASLLSEKATEASQNGFDRMSEMLSAMTGISKSTEDIRNVIDVIDDIAFQTNMLALNAAVEAARAGEAGMGFAVVADEVKNLANRSSESAKETAAMIKETLKNVETGMSISKDLSEIFKEILNNSKKVMEMNREVETASGQQDEGIGQVNKALIQLDSVVQTNASSAEETASAAEELQGQVSNLNEIVNTLYAIVTGDEYVSDQERLSLHDTSMPKSHKKNSERRMPRPSGNQETASSSSKDNQEEDAAHTQNNARETTLVKKDPAKKTAPKESGEKTEHKISFEDDEEFKAP